MLKYLFLLFSLISTQSISESLCAHLYHVVPIDTNKSIVELCNTRYVVNYDTKLNGIVSVSEIVSPGNYKQDRNLNFRIDKRLKAKNTPNQYLGDSIYDKGHMAAAGNANTPAEMKESFLMSNISPQHKKLNRGEWKQLETLIRRKITLAGKPTYVVTEPVYFDKHYLNGLAIPKGYFKRVYLDVPICYFGWNNAAGSVYKVGCEEKI